jgi:hypothetical protein
LERKSTKFTNKHEGYMESGFRRNYGQKLIRLYAKFTKLRGKTGRIRSLDSSPVLAGVTLLRGMTDGPSCFFVTFVDILYANKFLN